MEDVLRQAALYLDGKSYRDIAKIFGVSHVTIRYNLVYRLRNYDLGLYDKVMEKIEDNTEKNVRDINVQKRVLESFRLLVDENMTVKEIAEKMGVNEYVSYRDVTKRLKDLNFIAPEIVSSEMLERAKKTLNKHSEENLSIGEKNSFNILNLYKMFPNKERRLLFISKCALTFGLRLESLSFILQTDQDKIYRDLTGFDSGLTNYLYTLFKHGMKRQDIAIKNFEDYFVSLCEASMKKDKEEIKRLLGIISDEDAKDLIKERKEKRRNLTNDDIVTMLKHQIKYMITSSSTAKIFGTSKSNYEKRVKSLDKEYASLISDFDYLEDYYNSLANLSYSKPKIGRR